MRQVRLSRDGVTLYDQEGGVASFGPHQTKFASGGVDLGVSDIGRVTAGGQQMNPLSSVIPSTVVSPQPGWMPALGAVHAAIAVVWALGKVMDSMEERLGEQSGARTKRVSRYQVVDFAVALPESI